MRAKAWEKTESSVENITVSKTWEKAGKQRRKYYENAGNESKNMGKCRIEIIGNGIKTMGTWKAKMQEMSWEAKETRSKCRNPGNEEPCKIYEL